MIFACILFPWLSFLLLSPSLFLALLFCSFDGLLPYIMLPNELLIDKLLFVVFAFLNKILVLALFFHVASGSFPAETFLKDYQ